MVGVRSLICLLPPVPGKMLVAFLVNVPTFSFGAWTPVWRNCRTVWPIETWITAIPCPSGSSFGQRFLAFEVAVFWFTCFFFLLAPGSLSCRLATTTLPRLSGLWFVSGFLRERSLSFWKSSSGICLLLVFPHASPSCFPLAVSCSSHAAFYLRFLYQFGDGSISLLPFTARSRVPLVGGVRSSGPLFLRT